MGFFWFGRIKLMGLDKEQVIKILKDEHGKLALLINCLSSGQLEEEKVLGEWAVKDILAHLSAWDWEYVDEINRVLQNKATWHKLYESRGGEDDFNKREVGKRKNRKFNEIFSEWQRSFRSLIKRVENLTEKEWSYRSGKDVWNNGKPLTLNSLFSYEYENVSYEGGHAEQIKAHFRLN